MKTKLGIVAAFFVVLGFGMIHGHSPVMEYVSIALIGLGTSYLIYLLLSTGKSQSKDEPASGNQKPE
jgi:threonine/homoserine/homoserine lactone efflux protein